MSLGAPAHLPEVLRSFAVSLRGDELALARDFLRSLADHDDARVREASQYLRAALGALLTFGDDPAQDVAPRQLLELLLVGAERWLDYCEGELSLAATTAEDAGPHLGLLAASQQPLQPLRSMVIALRGALVGDASLERELKRRLADGLASITAGLRDGAPR